MDPVLGTWHLRDKELSNASTAKSIILRFLLDDQNVSH
jgi:hypothetical protein